MSITQPAVLCTALLIITLAVPSTGNRYSQPPNQKNIIQYQKTYDDHGTVYRMISSGAPGHDYIRVDGLNSPPQIASYVRGYTRRYEGVYERSCAICSKRLVRGGYEDSVRVCSIKQETSSGTVRYFHALVPSDDCNWVNRYASDSVRTEVRAVTAMYVTLQHDRVHERPRPFIATLCKGYDDLLYGTVSNDGAYCQPHDQEMRQFTFFAFGGDKFCPPLEEGSTWSIMYNREHGVRETTALYTCSLGNALVDGNGRLDCDSTGHWSGVTPECQPINCGEPPLVENGFFEGDSFEYQSTVTLQCNQGYEPSDTYRILSCQSTGHWSHRNLECTPRRCSYPMSPQNGRVIMHGGYSFMDEITFECQPGYRLEGSSEAICTENSEWSAEPPLCNKIVCEALLQPLHGARYGDNFDVGAVVAFSCFDGYVLFGASEVTCEQHGGQGVWSASPPVCEASDCGLPTTPDHGSVEAEGTTFGSRATFTCDTGFLLVGAEYASCTSEGWDADPPVCQGITCREPDTPENGRRNGDDFSYGAIVQYSCDTGYTITGTNTIVCQENGQWSARIPRCTAVECPPLPPLENGTRSGDIFEFGAVGVTFSCVPGFELIGQRSTTCGVTGEWSNPVPRCQPCPIGQYKEGVDGDLCQDCPEHSITLVPASSSIEHCICMQGTERSEDGQFCEAISCPVLESPENGFIVDCVLNYEGQCIFDCDPGHVLRGQDTTVCANYGWTNPVPFCQACPANTFKVSAGSLTCHPCPRNSHTNGLPGTQAEDCVCRPGYAIDETQGGGCFDVDECATENGGCNQVCDNTLGNYTCSCNIPGFEVGEDGHTCYAARSCPELPRDPAHGGLDCRFNEGENGYICFIECSAGYFFVSGQNNYITCGQETNFGWSHQLVNSSAAIPGCTEEFFVDTELPISFAYDANVPCEVVTGVQGEITDLIQDRVYHLEACAARCSVVNMNAECVDNEDGSSRLSVGFNIQLRNMEEGAVGSECDDSCKQRNMREMLRETFGIKTEIERLVQTSDADLQLDGGNNSIAVLNPGSFAMGSPTIECNEDGRVFTRTRQCVPCAPGYFLEDRSQDHCTPCPLGTYQRHEGQTECVICPEDSTTIQLGASHPTMCSVRISEIEGNRIPEVPPSANYTLSTDLSDIDVEEVLSVLK